jgi:hypothetical protein
MLFGLFVATHFRVLISDYSRIRACVMGIVIGGFGTGFRSVPISSMVEVSPTQLQMLIVLILALVAGAAASFTSFRDLNSKRLASGIGSRVGLQAGLFAALAAGGLLTFLATSDVRGAETANADFILRQRMWLTFLVSVASILPSILGGFIGGLVGALILKPRLPFQQLETSAAAVPGLKWITGALVIITVIGLAAPFSILGRPPKTDPLPIPDPPLPAPPSFVYRVPEGIKTAKIGTIQPDFTKTITPVMSDGAVSLSPDGNFFAYVEELSNEPRVIVFDLNKFEKVGSMSLPAAPRGCLAWSPDQKSLACVTGRGREDRRIWILKIASSDAIELPRPHGGDVPDGDVFWWQPNELIFYPEDEALPVLNLDDLKLHLAQDSDFLNNADEPTKHLWKVGPRIAVPKTADWTVDLKTLIRGANHPSRRSPDDIWQLKGDTVVALTHPKSDIAIAFNSLSVKEGMRMLCVPDGSKIIRIADGRAEVTYMKLAEAPVMHLKVTMPIAFEEIKDEVLKLKVELKKLCAFVYAPLDNPLNKETVGPDFNIIKATARILEWKGKNAVFIITTFDRAISGEDVIASLHSWDAGSMDLVKSSGLRNWWDIPERFRGDLPTSELEYLDSPAVFALASAGTSLQVVKASERPRPPKPKDPVTVKEASIAQVSDTEVKAFLTAHHAMASSGDLAGLATHYDDTVDFLDKGRIPQSKILAEEQAHRLKWPQGNEKIVGDMSISKNGDAWNADYIIEFYNESTTGDWQRGKAAMHLVIIARDQGLLIREQRARPYEVEDSKTILKLSAEETAKQAQKLKNLADALTVPKPCFHVTVKDSGARNVEFTDLISFADGVYLHRTFREKNQAGQVIGVCRAIYNVNGGLSKNLLSATVNVVSKKWQRDLGNQDLKDYCSKRADSLLGKSYRYQITMEGLVDVDGVLFRIIR